MVSLGETFHWSCTNAPNIEWLIPKFVSQPAGTAWFQAGLKPGWMSDSFWDGHQKTAGVKLWKAARVGKMMRAGKNRFQPAWSRRKLASRPTLSWWPPVT